MDTIKQAYLTGERALFHASDVQVEDSTFAQGESPLKESRNIRLHNSIFKWKYPLWYSTDIECSHITLMETARSGIWYSEHVTMKDCVLQAPKTFRRCSDITLENVQLPNAQETFWNCSDIRLQRVHAAGDYFAMNAENITIDEFTLSGNYAFDGAKHVELHHATLLSKDAFWNCEDVTVYDSLIIGEYLGWNAKNLTLVNCTIESLQGMCYIDNLIMKNCKLINTTLAFEYSSVDAQIDSKIDSVLNPSSGVIRAKHIDHLIIEKDKVDITKTKIICEEA